MLDQLRKGWANESAWIRRLNKHVFWHLGFLVILVRDDTKKLQQVWVCERPDEGLARAKRWLVWDRSDKPIDRPPPPDYHPEQ